MSAFEGLAARVSITIEDARLTIRGDIVDIEVPRILVAIPREDCTELTRRMLPEAFALPAIEFGVGQQVGGRISDLRRIELEFEGNAIHFRARPHYRLDLHQYIPMIGRKQIATIKGDVDVPGSIRLVLEKPGVPLPDVGIIYEITPGVPNVLNIPDWAETTFRPGGQTIRDVIRQHLTRRELIHPFKRFEGLPQVQKVSVQQLELSTDETHVRLCFAVQAEVPH